MQEMDDMANEVTRRRSAQSSRKRSMPCRPPAAASRPPCAPAQPPVTLADVTEGARGSSSASSSARPPVTLADVTEGARGFLHIPGRSKPIAQLTAWGASISARCMLDHHKGRCNRAYPITKLPRADTLRQWALDGLNATTSAEHMSLPKPMGREGA